jgi:hypothetical protein
MFRFFAILGCFWALEGGVAQAQLRGDNSTSTYYGQNYLIPTPFNPCHSASFNDHGQSVMLCIDNFGRPIPASNRFPSDGRSPASARR